MKLLRRRYATLFSTAALTISGFWISIATGPDAQANPLRLPEREPPTEEERRAFEIPGILRKENRVFGDLTISVDAFAHTLFRDHGASQGFGFALLPRLPFEVGALRPELGAYWAKSLERYAVLDAGLFYEDASTGNALPYFGLATGLSLENKLTWKSVMAGPAVGAHFRVIRAISLSVALHVYWNTGFTNQVRVGIGVNP